MNKLTIFFTLIVALCFNMAFAAKQNLTPEQLEQRKKLKEERIQKSEEADKLIRHITVDEFKNNILTDKENLNIVFYGSHRCPFTQRFNPKWLSFQRNFDKKRYEELADAKIKIQKIECYGENFDFCVSQGNQYWPELMFYFKGKKIATYDGEDEIEDIVKYIADNMKKFMEINNVESKENAKDNNDNKETDKNTNNESKPAKPELPPKKPVDTKPKKVVEQKPKEVPQQIEQKPKEIPKPIEQKPKEIPAVNNAIDENDNAIDENEIKNQHNDFIYNDESNNKAKTEDKKPLYAEPMDPVEEGNSHTVIISVGGLAACAAGFMFAKKRFRGHGYARVGSNERSSQMRYKYNKHIV